MTLLMNSYNEAEAFTWAQTRTVTNKEVQFMHAYRKVKYKRIKES